jgi:cysteinyl-tRNA synthetase
MEVRYVLLSGHYRKPLNFTLASLHAAKEAMTKLAKSARGKTPLPYKKALDTENFGVFQSAWDKLNDDLNTAGALGELFGNVKKASTDNDWAGFFAILAALGLELPESEPVKVPKEIAALAALRWEARAAKDWKASDRLRDELAEKGWVVKDGSEGYEVVPL